MVMTQHGSGVVNSQPGRSGARSGQVLPFRRPEPPLPVSAGGRAGAEVHLPDDFAEYEQDRDEIIDYRQRMLMNLIALGIVTLLVTTGVWMADTLAVLQKNQDCILQGRSNCAPINLPGPKRQ